MKPEAIGRRATLKKAESPDIVLEILRIGAFEFAGKENGITTTPVLHRWSKREAMSGGGPASMTVDAAWGKFLEKFPGYEVTGREELFPAA
jgi:hypothetical protein